MAINIFIHAMITPRVKLECYQIWHICVEKGHSLQRSSTIPNHLLSCPLTASMCSSKSLFHTQIHTVTAMTMLSWIMRGCGKGSSGGVPENEPSREDTHAEWGRKASELAISQTQHWVQT